MQPSQSALQMLKDQFAPVQAAYQQNSGREMLQLLDKLEGQDEASQVLRQYWQAEAWILLGRRERGQQILEALAERWRDQRPSPEGALAYALAKGLRSLGILYRDLQHFDKALTTHQLYWIAMREAGTLEEQHEALMSLDSDAAALKQYRLSLLYLQWSLELTSVMPEGEARQKAEFLSWNNLSLSYEELRLFEQAEKSLESLHSLAQQMREQNAKFLAYHWESQARLAELAWARAEDLSVSSPKQAEPYYSKAQQLRLALLQEWQKTAIDAETQRPISLRLRKICEPRCEND